MSTSLDNTPPGAVLTIDGAAAYLSISKATLYTWRTRRAGYGPRAIKAGGRLLYRRADLDAWLDEHVETFDQTSTEHDPARSGAAPEAGRSLSRTSRPR